MYLEKYKRCYSITNVSKFFDIFENEDILKCGYKQKQDYILLKQNGIESKNLMFDIEIAGYILQSGINKYTIEYLSNEYLGVDIDGYVEDAGANTQMNLFDVGVAAHSYPDTCGQVSLQYIYPYIIKELYYKLSEKMKETESIELFRQY